MSPTEIRKARRKAAEASTAVVVKPTPEGLRPDGLRPIVFYMQLDENKLAPEYGGLIERLQKAPAHLLKPTKFQQKPLLSPLQWKR